MKTSSSTASAHSDGQWTIQVNERNEHLICANQAGCIAVMSQLENESEEAANARLIAAAPDLLVAANAAADILASIVTDNVSDHGEEATFAKLVDAIAKAEGQPYFRFPSFR